MEKKNRLDELPIASLNEEQLRRLKQAEEQLNQEGNGIYLIALQKETPSL
jgi:hypothetical protein